MDELVYWVVDEDYHLLRSTPDYSEAMEKVREFTPKPGIGNTGSCSRWQKNLRLHEWTATRVRIYEATPDMKWEDYGPQWVLARAQSQKRQVDNLRKDILRIKASLKSARILESDREELINLLKG